MIKPKAIQCCRLFTTPSQLKFAFFILAPYFLEFLLPLIFIKTPIKVPVTQYWVGFSQMLYAFFVASVWFLLIFLVIAFPLKGSYAKRREWPAKLTLPLLLGFTVIGFIANCINYLLVFPLNISQIIYVFISLPLLSVVIATYYLKFQFRFVMKNRQKIRSLVLLTVVFNCTVIVSFPILSGGINLLLFSVITIIFAYTLMQPSWRKILLASCFALALASVAQATKVWLRMRWYHGEIISKIDMRARTVQKAERAHYNQHELNEVGQSSLSKTIAVHDLYHIPFVHNKYFYYPDYAFSKFVARVDALPEFAVVVEKTPSEYPYWYEYSYKRIPAVFIPRLFWRSKPVDHVGNFYAHRYGFIEKNDYYTQDEMGGPPEAWVSFGWLGIIVSALVFGFILRIIWMFLVGENPALGNIFLASVIVFNAGRLESDAAIVLGNLFHVVIVYWLLEVFVRRYLVKMVK